MAALSQRFVKDIRNSLFEKIELLPLDYFSEKQTGALLSRITYDVAMLQDSVAVALTDFLFYPFQLLIYIGFIFSIHWKLALLSLVLIPLITFPVIRIGKRLRKVSLYAMESMADLNNVLHEFIAGVRIVKVFNMESHEKAKFEQANQNFYRYTMKRIKRVLAIGPFSESVAGIGALSLLFVGGRAVVQNKFSSGVLLLFLAALFSLIKPSKRLVSSYGLLQETLAVVPRIFEILDATPGVVDRENATVLAPIRHRLEFRNVFFRYDTRDVLQDISFTVFPGKVVAIVGRSGSGKTTLVNLIPRFYDPNQGAIFIDGIDLRSVTLHSLRAQIGVVTQETFLFHDTVETNIAYGKVGAVSFEIEKAARLAHAHEFISRLPNGYQTVIGERGMKLSGGERQRIAIARAILKNPPILILDEATSQLDTESERYVQAALEQLMKGRTVFVIAHRLSTIVNADWIVVLDGGRVMEVGTHVELLKREGLYKKLYSIQFQEVMND